MILSGKFLIFRVKCDLPGTPKEKPLCGRSPQRGLDLYFLFLSTITGRTAANNNGGDKLNGNNIVEKLFHLFSIL